MASRKKENTELEPRIYTLFIHCISKKFPPLNCNFVKSQPILNIFALLKGVWNLLQNRTTPHFRNVATLPGK